jgi:hypothetical protein
MNDILPILALVSVAGIGLLQMFKPSPAAYSNSTTGGRRRKTRKNLKK